MTGEKIYEYDPDLTGVDGLRVTMQAILSGQVRVHGVDYLRIRSAGRIDLDIHAVIEIEDGYRIALAAPKCA